jgi:hypothetical protein
VTDDAAPVLPPIAAIFPPECFYIAMW